MQLEIQGTQIFANNGGRDFDPERPTVLLVHGAGMDHSVWGQQTRYLAHHGFNALALDLPGHGRSGGEALETIDQLADFLARVINALAVAEVMLVGHSMGALASLQAGASHGDKIRALVLCGAAATMPVHPVLLERARADDIDAARLIAAWGHGSASHKGGNIVHGMWMIGCAIRLLDRSRKGVLYKDLVACNVYDKALEAAAGVQCPTLLLLAGEDKMAPVRAAGPLLAALPDGRQTVIDKSGHMMMYEAPDICRTRLMDFLRSCGPLHAASGF